MPNHTNLINQQQAFEMIKECAKLGIWELFSTNDGLFIRMDAQASVVFNFPAEEQTLHFSRLVDSCKVEDRPRIQAEMQELLANPGQTKTFEYRVWNQLTKDWRWIRSFGKSLQDEATQQTYVLGSAQDIQESLAFQPYADQANDANARVQIMLDATPLCCNFWDENFNNIDCNQEAATLFDLPSKQAYLDNFGNLSPEYQPDGELSSAKALQYVREAFANGKVIFEWMHQKLNGELIPAEITLVRVNRLDGDIVVGYTRDLREYKKMMTATQEANERAQIMLDATPLCCNFWDENFNNIDCNQEAATLFDLPSKQAYLDNFANISPEYQPDGEPSSAKALQYIREAFASGKVVFEWMHQKLNGELIPSEITLVRVNRLDGDIVVGYTRDLREYKKMMAAMQEANERTQIMLDATPLCCNFWDENFNNIDCNQEAATLFDLPSKQAYLDNFGNLSPEYQPNGEPSGAQAHKYIREAFASGKVVFEWMHQKLNGELIPSEITLVRVNRLDGDIVVGYTRDLREYKKMMAATQEANERTQIMLDATPLCCNLWDENLNNIDCNQEAATLFDLPSKQAYLDNFENLSPQYQPDGELSGAKAHKYIREAFASGKIVFEWMHQKLNGELIPSEITLVRVNRIDGDIVAGYTRDLREYKQMMAATQEANERTQIMLDATPLCCNLWDENLNNVDCNAEAVKLFDLQSKQEYLDRFFELSPEYQPCGRLSAELAQEKILKAFRDGDARFEWMHKKLDGEQIPSEITLVRVKRGESLIVSGYTRDMREHTKMMEEIKQVEADLRLARDAAEESARSKSEFLANMSHEIRTPMNAILGMLHLIQTDSTENLSFKQSDYLNKIEQSAKTLLRIINDILDFSKIEANRLEMENVAFSLSDVLLQTHNLFDQSIEDKRLTFDIITPESMDYALMGDPLRLTQILMNFMSNAIKFTEKGSITLSVTETARTSDHATFQFSVKDTGVGMNPEQIARLFNPFTQADTSTTRRYGGTGLGLAISKRLVHLMDGDIWCESEPGKGSEFCMTARFQLTAANASPLAKTDSINTESAHDPAIDLKALKPILLAEDNEINQIIAKELLTIKGYKVDIANNGQEAIDKLLSGDYSLILMDIQMPIMDGLTATQKIRQMDRFKDIPILAMTAHAMSGDFEKSLSVGMNDHITKPIQPDILYQTLQKWTKRHQ